MSWTKIIPTQVGRVTGVTFSIVPERKSDCSRLSVSIARSLADAAGLTAGGRADLFVGDGEDAGTMRVVANPTGGYVAKGKGETACLRVMAAAPKKFPQELKTQICTVLRVSASGVAFELPWAKQKPESEVMPTESALRTGIHDTSPVSATQGDQPAAKALAAVDQVARKANGRFSGKAPQPNAVVLASAGPISIRSIVEETAPPPAKPPPHPVAQARKPLTYAFTHKGKTVDLDPRHHALAERLQKAMGKGFLDYDTLMKGCAISSVEHLHGTVSALRKKLEPLGLDIGPQPKMGYFMKETAGIVG